MILKQNGILKIIVPGVIAIAVILGIKAMKSRGDSTLTDNKPESYVINDLKPEELRALGIDGDTPQDTIRTLVGTVKQARQDIELVKQQNAQLLKENKILQQQATDVEAKVAEVVSREKENMSVEFENQFQSRADNILGELEKKFENISGDKISGHNSDIPIGLGLEGESLPGQLNGNSDQNIRWIMPADMQQLDRNGNPLTGLNLGQQADKTTFPNPFNKLDDSTVGKAHQDFTDVSHDNDENTEPMYTLPENSTLIGSISMTALLGRVPLNGVVSDPYPFKIMVGRDNLTANGIDLPDVEGAIIAGTASGDWTLSCVRGNVHSMTLVFADGTVRTLPKDKRSNNSDSNSENIGWISDPHGLPCVPGDRKTNASKFLATSFLLGGASAAAQAWSQGQTTTVVDGNSVVGAVTGDQGKYVAGQAIGAGLKDTVDWIRQRYGQVFDAVYVPPGHPVAVHITKSLEIDYENNGRKVNYKNNQQYGTMD